MTRARMMLAGLTLALTAAASAASAAPFEFMIKPSTAQFAAVMVRLNTASGQAVLSNGGQAFVPIMDSAPVPSGDYHLMEFSTLDNGASTQEWDFYRTDQKSGRAWYLTSDGKNPPAWVEIPAAH